MQLFTLFLAGHIHRAEIPKGFLHAPESGHLASAGKGHPVARLPRAVRQNVLPLRGQGLHETGPREEVVSR